MERLCGETELPPCHPSNKSPHRVPSSAPSCAPLFGDSFSTSQGSSHALCRTSQNTQRNALTGPLWMCSGGWQVLSSYAQMPELSIYSFRKNYTFISKLRCNTAFVCSLGWVIFHHQMCEQHCTYKATSSPEQSVTSREGAPGGGFMGNSSVRHHFHPNSWKTTLQFDFPLPNTLPSAPCQI